MSTRQNMKTLIIVILSIFYYCGVGLSGEPQNPMQKEQDKIKSPAEIKSFFKKSRSVEADFQISDLELRLAMSFELDSDTLNKKSQTQLDNLASVLLEPEFSALTIELAGHTCDLGDANYNLQLSSRRVQHAFEYLVDKHRISPNRITTRAYGESRPLIIGARKESERAVNRRVVTYLTENRETIEKMLDAIPYNLGFRWAVFRYTKDNKAELIEYDGSSILKSDDAYRVFLRPARRKYVYIFQEDSRGKNQWLFPRKDLEYSNPLEPGEYFLPSRSKVFVLDDNVGTESIYLVVTDEPAAELEALIDNDAPNLIAEAVKKTVLTRGLKKIRIGPPVDSTEVTLNTVVISPQTQELLVSKDLAVPPKNVANIMAQYSEFFVVLEFEHR